MLYDPTLSQPDAGLYRYWVEREGGDVTLVTQQDVAPILEQNKAMANEGDGYSPSRELRRVASVPDIVQEMWLKEYGFNPVTSNDKSVLRKLLNSSDWAYLRTAPGRL